MPCYRPLHASFTVGEDGKKKLRFSGVDASASEWSHFAGVATESDNLLQLPCGRCVGCRLERSRQWATRCMHEAQLYEHNCFVTLTYSPECLPVNQSLDKREAQNFLKRLRQRALYDGKICVQPIFDEDGTEKRPIRTLYCGEYGEQDDGQLGRPHYHFILFNCFFSDRVFYKRVGDYKLFCSPVLTELWGKGHAVVSDFSFDTAAYVARYSLKKVTGDKAVDHYKKVLPNGVVVDLLPEFLNMSLKPGIGRGWIDRYGESDCFSYDTVVVRGVKCKPPRYYDKILEKSDPVRFERIKQSRIESAKDRLDDCTYDRLLARERCQELRIKQLVRDL